MRNAKLVVLHFSEESFSRMRGSVLTAGVSFAWMRHRCRAHVKTRVNASTRNAHIGCGDNRVACFGGDDPFRFISPAHLAPAPTLAHPPLYPQRRWQPLPQHEQANQYSLSMNMQAHHGTNKQTSNMGVATASFNTIHQHGGDHRFPEHGGDNRFNNNNINSMFSL